MLPVGILVKEGKGYFSKNRIVIVNSYAGLQSYPLPLANREGVSCYLPSVHYIAVHRLVLR